MNVFDKDMVCADSILPGLDTSDVAVLDRHLPPVTPPRMLLARMLRNLLSTATPSQEMVWLLRMYRELVPISPQMQQQMRQLESMVREMTASWFSFHVVVVSLVSFSGYRKLMREQMMCPERVDESLVIRDDEPAG
jgi:hypothetical protein